MTWTLSAFADEAGASCEAQIAALQRGGLQRLDLRSIDGYNVSVLPPEVARQVKTRLDAAGITVQMLGSPLGKIDIADDFAIDLDKLRHIARIAPILGCQAVRIFSYYNKNQAPHAEWRTQSLRRLETLRDQAENLGLVLFHENERHIFGDKCADVMQIAALRSANFQLIFDFDNYNQSGEDVAQNWQKLKASTDAFHLKDSTLDNEHVPAGEGNGKIAEILADARKTGWSGPLAIEPHLSHSGAVAATGPSGKVSAAYRDMPPAESFHLAVEAAKNVLAGARVGWK